MNGSRCCNKNWSKKTKKIFQYFLFIVVIFAMAACAGNPATPAPENQDDVDQAGSTEKTKLVFWIHAAEPFIKAHEEIAALYEEENPNVDIEIQSFPFADFGTKVAVEVPAGSGPDIMEGYGPWMSIYMRTGKVDAVPESFMTTEEMKERYYESTLTDLEYDGKYYGVPSNVAAGSTRVLLVNDNDVESAGVDLSKNQDYEDWIETWQALTKTDESGKIVRSGLGLYCGQTADLFVSYLMEYGGSVTDETGKTATFNSEAGRKALQMIVDLVDKYEVDSVQITDFSCVANGTAATSYRGTWVIPDFVSAFPDFKYHYELMPLPTGATEEVWQGGAGWATFVPAGSENKAEAWKFVQFLEDHRKPWIINTSEIPADRALAAEMNEENPELYGVFYPILEQSKHGYPYGDYFQIQSTFQDMVTSVLLGKESVEEALSNTEKLFQNQLDQWWQKF